MKKNARIPSSDIPVDNRWKHVATLPWLNLFFLFVVIFVVYAPALSVPPYLDDNSAILENSRITNIDNLPLIFENFFFGRGLVQLTLALEWHFSKDAIPIMHLSNIVMHVLATLLVFYCARSIWKFLYPEVVQQANWPLYGLLSSSFFALHPINTQPVTYIISRADILATIFYLLGIIIPLQLFFFYSSQKRTALGHTVWLGLIAIIVGLCFVLGLSCKEIIVTLPPALLLLFIYSWRHEKLPVLAKRIAFFCLPILIIFGAYFLYRKIMLGNFLYFPDIEARSPLVNLYTQICIIVLYYIPRVFVPVNLLLRPPFPLAQTWTDPRLLFSFSIVLLLIGLAAILWRKKPEISFGILWFFLTLAPTSSFLPLWDLIAERRIYIASIGVAILAESFFFSLKRYSPKNLYFSSVGFLSCILFLFSLLTIFRNFEYQNPVQFWQKEHSYSPYNLENLHNYLYALSQKGENERAKIVLVEIDWTKIKEQNEFIDTGSLDFLIRLMLHHKIEVEYASFLAEKNAAKFNDPFSLNTYQLALMVQRRFKDAMDAIDKTLAIDPNHVDTLFNKAIIYRIFGQYVPAQECLNLALQIQPDNITLLEEQVELLKALQQDTRAVEMKINDLKKRKKDSPEMELKSSL